MADQRKLLIALQSGTATDDEILELWESVRRFALYIAKKYKKALRTSEEEQDLEQEAFLAMLDAAKNYDLEQSASFVHFYAYALHNVFSQYVARQNGVGRGTNERLRKVRRYEAEFSQIYGREPTDKEICQRFSISMETLQALRSRGRVESLDEMKDDSDGRPTYEPATYDDPESVTIRKLEDLEMRQTVRRRVEELPIRERKAIRLYYFDGLTIKEAAREMKTTPSRFLTLRNAALKRLRRGKRAEELRRLIPDVVAAKIYRNPRRGSIWQSSTEWAAFKLINRECSSYPPFTMPGRRAWLHDVKSQNGGGEESPFVNLLPGEVPRLTREDHDEVDPAGK